MEYDNLRIEIEELRAKINTMSILENEEIRKLKNDLCWSNRQRLLLVKALKSQANKNLELLEIIECASA